jgi:hypothetical protein
MYWPSPSERVPWIYCCFFFHFISESNLPNAATERNFDDKKQSKAIRELTV